MRYLSLRYKLNIQWRFRHGHQVGGVDHLRGTNGVSGWRLLSVGDDHAFFCLHDLGDRHGVAAIGFAAKKIAYDLVGIEINGWRLRGWYSVARILAPKRIEFILIAYHGTFAGGDARVARLREGGKRDVRALRVRPTASTCRQTAGC